MVKCIQALLFFWAMSFSGFAAEFYVSPTGKDSDPGSLAAPFASLERAQKAAREVAGKEPVEVFLRGGTYRLTETFALTAEDSGRAGAEVAYQAYRGESVTISGTRLLDLQWTPFQGKVLKAEVPAGVEFDQLFVNGTRQIRARFPNFNPENPLRSGAGYLAVTDGSNSRYDTWFSFDPGTFTRKKWSNPSTGIVHAFQSHNWGNLQYRIRSVDWGTNKVFLGDGGWQMQRQYGIGKAREESSPYFIENIFEELDSPGEWFFDRETQMLYFWPPEGLDVPRAQYEAVVLKDLVRFNGTPKRPVRFVSLKGFRFTGSRTTFLEPYEPLARGDWAIHRGGAVLLEGAEDCTIEDCNFEFVGGNGVFMSGYNRRNRVAGCRFYHTGESGVAVVGSPQAVRLFLTWDDQEIKGLSWEEMRKGMDLAPGPKTEDFPQDCRIENGLFYEIGDFGKQTSGVVLSMSSRITVSHCTIFNIPRAGITVNDGTWGGHIIEFNDIWETVRETGEHGPFNSWGRERMWLAPKGDGAMVKEMVLLDAMEPVVIRNNRIANYRRSVSAGNWTIDLDDGSSNYYIYNNLSLGSTLKLRDGYFRKVWNNIFVSPVSLGWHCWPPESEDEFYSNVVVIAGAVPGSNEASTSQLRPIRMPEHPWGSRIDRNLYWNVNTQEFRVEDLDWEQWQKLGYDRSSLFADPLFSDPLNHDFRVGKSSPALTIGFSNFEMDQFGHQMTRILPFGGEFSGRIEVEIRPDSRGGEVRYTTDGTPPTTESSLYRSPVVLDESVLVRAATFRAGVAIGFPASAQFTKVARVERPSWLQTMVLGHWAGGDGKSERKQEPLRWKGAVLIPLQGDDNLIDATGGWDSGAFVLALDESSDAFGWGLRRWDIISKINGKEVLDLESFERLVTEAGDAIVSIEVIRNYDRLELRGDSKPVR